MNSAAKNRGFFRLLLTLCLCFVCKGLFYAILFPMWEGYDEYAHFAFIHHAATHLDLPDRDTKVSREVDVSLELVPLPWLLKDWPPPHVPHDTFWKLSPEERQRRQAELWRMPESFQHEAGRADLYEGQQGPFYYWLMAPIYFAAKHMPLANRVFLFRIVNVLLGALVLPIIFFVSERVLVNRELSILATVLAATLPEFYIDVARVGNQTLATVLYGAATLLALKIIDGETRLLPGSGAIVGLLLLTKAYALAVVPVLLGIVTYSWWVNRDSRTKPRRYIAAIVLVPTIAGWWYARNLLMAGSIIWNGGAPQKGTGIWNIIRTIPSVDWRAAGAALFASHLWQGNWSFLGLRSWMYHIFQYAVLLTIIGVGLKTAQAYKERRFKHGSAQLRHVVVLLSVFLSFLAGIAYHVLITFLDSGVGASEGWYIYAVIVAEVALCVLGLSAFKWGRYLIVGIIVALTFLELYATHWILIPYYTGLISHTIGGSLKSFHWSEFTTIGLPELLNRLVINRASLVNHATLGVSWALYLASSAVLCFVAFRAALGTKTSRVA